MVIQTREIEKILHFFESMGSEDVPVHRITNQLVLQRTKKKHNGSLQLTDKSTNSTSIILHSTKEVPHYRSNPRGFLPSGVNWR